MLKECLEQSEKDGAYLTEEQKKYMTGRPYRELRSEGIVAKFSLNAVHTAYDKLLIKKNYQEELRHVKMIKGMVADNLEELLSEAKDKARLEKTVTTMNVSLPAKNVLDKVLTEDYEEAIDLALKTREPELLFKDLEAVIDELTVLPQYKAIKN